MDIAPEWMSEPTVQRGAPPRPGVERFVPSHNVPTRHEASRPTVVPPAASQTASKADVVPASALKGPVTARTASAVKRCPVVAITSGKGGVGKTTLSVNLSIAMSSLRHRTTLLDADLGLANADVLCGMSPTTRLDATVETAMLDSRTPRTLSTIAVPAPGGFMLVPGCVGVARMANLPVSQRRTILAGLEGLERVSDLVLIDTGAGLSDGVTTFVAAADVAIVVCTPEPTSIADAYAMIKCVVHGTRSRPDLRPRFGLLVNQARKPEEGPSVHARLSSTARKFLGVDFPLLGTLPDDDEVVRSIRARSPLMLSAPTSPAACAIARASREIARFLQLPDHGPTTRARQGLLASLRGWITAR
jgi:flagellar biosynthesis protein FlhG